VLRYIIVCNVKTYWRFGSNEGAVGKVGCVLVEAGPSIEEGTVLYPYIHNTFYMTLGS